MRSDFSLNTKSQLLYRFDGIIIIDYYCNLFSYNIMYYVQPHIYVLFCL